MLFQLIATQPSSFWLRGTSRLILRLTVVFTVRWVIIYFHAEHKLSAKWTGSVCQPRVSSAAKYYKLRRSEQSPIQIYSELILECNLVEMAFPPEISGLKRLEHTHTHRQTKKKAFPFKFNR